jgi:hypothetical protein
VHLAEDAHQFTYDPILGPVLLGLATFLLVVLLDLLDISWTLVSVFVKVVSISLRWNDNERRLLSVT